MYVRVGDMGLQNIPLKVNAVCVHEIHEAIRNWEIGSPRLTVAVSPGNSTQTQTEISSFSLEEAYFLILKAKTSNTYLGVYYSPHQNLRSQQVPSSCSPSVPPQVTSVSVKGACAPLWPPRFCGCCQRTHSLSCSPGPCQGLHSWVQQDSSKLKKSS